MTISIARATTNAVTNTTIPFFNLLRYVLSKYEFNFEADIPTYAHSNSIFMPYCYYHNTTITSTSTTMSRDSGKGEVSSLRSGIQGNLASILDRDKLPSLPYSLQTEFRT